MAGFFQGVDKALTNLSQSPVGMAGMGLLMMPSQSLTPINPWQYAAEGMQMGVQNQQAAQKLRAQEAERARQEAIAQQLLPLLGEDFGGLEAIQGMTPEDITRMVEIRQAIIQNQEAAIKEAKEKAELKRRETAISQYQEKLDPSQRLAFDALPLDEQAKIAAKLAFPDADTGSNMTSAAKNALALGLQPRSAEWNAYIRQATLPAPPATINLGRPLTPAEIAGLELPGGGNVPLGTTIEQAASLGAAPIPKPPTEGQALSAGFYERMSQANGAITPEREQLLSQASEAIAARTPLIGNYLSSPEYQIARQAQEDFVTAVLRKESGAVIGKDEMQDAIRKYFPQPGDKEEVIKQKRKLRDTETQSMRRAAGRALQGASTMITPAGVSVTPNFGGSQQSIEEIARKYLK